MTQKHSQNKKDKLDFIKLKTCVSKGSNRNVKGMGKIFPSYTSDKDAVSRTYKKNSVTQEPNSKIVKEIK